ncbi:MAG TPA: T9SS type A sorting domain-containing protein [Ignavibacteria bacterium]|nr:T9SS type A sorting domain-containing protein [Ignavibacteria bacterium]
MTWQKWYDYNNYEDNGQDVVQTYDGGYVILANNYSPSTGSTVLKIDQYGNLEWSQLYNSGNVGGFSLNCSTISQLNDSGYIISGSNRDSAIIFKINKIGDVSWIKKYSKFGLYGGFLDHKLTSDGGIIACGYLYDPSVGYVVKTDSIGNIQWDSIYSQNSDILKIIQGSDDLYYMLGIGGVDLFKTNSFGSVIWRKYFSLPNKIDILEHPSGDIFVGGGVDSMIIYKIDTSGNTIYKNGYFNGVIGCRCMCFSDNGNILLSGNDRATHYMAVSEIYPDGKLLFNKLIITIINTAYVFLPIAVTSTNDLGFIITGYTNYPPNFHESNIYVSKVDSACESPLMVGINKNNSIISDNFKLYQNYPNPFNPNTRLKYDLYKPGFVILEIFDLKGKKICNLVNKYQQSGSHEIQFNAVNYSLPSGVYFCKLSLNKKSVIVKLVLLK